MGGESSDHWDEEMYNGMNDHLREYYAQNPINDEPLEPPAASGVFPTLNPKAMTKSSSNKRLAQSQPAVTTGQKCIESEPVIPLFSTSHVVSEVGIKASTEEFSPIASSHA